MSESGNSFWFELRDIAKSFGGITALSGVHLGLRKGEVHGLIGENGAGKSTLINIATGVHRPDSGQILLDGTPVQLSGPRDAHSLGISVVHQESELFADMTLAENMLLSAGLPTALPGMVSWKEVYRQAEEALAEFDLDLPVRARARDLSVAQRVLAQIATALHFEASVLFLDEPTASLTHRECDLLFERLSALRQRGVAIVYVSHRLEEVLALCDRITVLRDGAHVWTRPVGEVDLETMVEAMVGRTVTHFYPPKPDREPGAEILSVSGLEDSEGSFRDISFSVRSGEILGLYGLVGAGRSEMAQTLFGLRSHSGGTIRIHGRELTANSPGAARKQGLAYLPEDRLTQGVFRGLSVRENAVSAILRRISNTLTLVRKKRENESTQRVFATTRVKAESPESPLVTLSGGNQQKVVLGRWLETEPEVLLLDEPTRGVDVGAKAEIHDLIAELANSGKGVLLISSELPEVLAMSHRVAVMCEGRLVGEFNPETDSPETIAAAAFPISHVPEQGSVSESPTARQAQAALGFGIFREAGIGAALVLLMAVLSILRPESFLTFSNLADILSSVAILAVAALGATFVIGAGGIDISVGSMLGLVGAASGMLAIQGVPPPLCLLAAIAMGGGLGGINAVVGLIGRVHPIIVTLAGLSIYRGLMIRLTGGYEVSGLPDTYRSLADGFTLGVPRVLWFTAVVLILAWALLQRSTFGRKLLAVGNSRSAADQIGLSAGKLLTAAFVVNGAFIGLASVMWGAYYGKLQSAAGEGLELQAIAAAVIGGCNIMGGSGTALGTFLGACLIGVINNGLTLLRIETYWQPVFIGFFILATVLVDGWMNRGGKKRGTS
jgi:ABC-type sugar transport system ATPase subunit/ribose/xylose/arabinose/galactoside ABC-type transport system permease subunit